MSQRWSANFAQQACEGVNRSGVWKIKKTLPFAEYFRQFLILIFKVSTEDLEEQMVGFEDYVQSVDIVAFNKI